MLCPDYDSICTNKCEHRLSCKRVNAPSHRKIPFLIKVQDRLISKIEPNELNGLPIITYKIYAVAPHVFENDLLNQTSPALIKGTNEKRTTFYVKGSACQQNFPLLPP